jgi:hypothetical protein
LPRGVEGLASLHAACGVVAAVVLGLAACGAKGGDDPSAVRPPDPGRCGGTFREEPRAGLTLAGSFPERVRATRDATVEGTVTVTNHTDRRVEGLSASRPEVYVTRAGEIVATPLPRDEVGIVLDLAQGAARDFAAAGSLRSCSRGEPLPPGDYEVHAVLRVVEADGAQTVAAVGGPWRLEIV